MKKTKKQNKNNVMNMMKRETNMKTGKNKMKTDNMKTETKYRQRKHNKKT